MGFCTQISVPGTLYGDYKWKSSHKEQPLLDGLYIGIFDEGDDKVSFLEIEYKKGNWNWFHESEKPCSPIAWVGVPSCDLYVGKCNDGYGDDTSGLIVSRPWKNAKTERPAKATLYFVLTKIYSDEYSDGYVVSPSEYDTTAKIFDCELSDPKEEVFAYIEMPTNYNDIF